MPRLLIVFKAVFGFVNCTVIGKAGVQRAVRKWAWVVGCRMRRQSIPTVIDTIAICKLRGARTSHVTEGVGGRDGITETGE